jgi:hypothetical protein
MTRSRRGSFPQRFDEHLVTFWRVRHNLLSLHRSVNVPCVEILCGDKKGVGTALACGFHLLDEKRPYRSTIARAQGVGDGIRLPRP